MARAVAARGHEVAIYTTDRELGAEERTALAARPADGVDLRMFPQHFPAVIGASLPLARALGEAIPRADVVHIHSLYLFHTFIAARIARQAGVPYLIRPHGTLDPFLWKRHRARKQVMEMLFQNHAFRGAAALHYTAEEEMRLAAPYACGAKGVVVPNGLSMADYADIPPEGEFRRRRPELAGKRIVLFLSRLNFKKGLDVLVPAFAQAAASRPDLYLVIAGPDDGEKAPTEALIAAHGIGARVTFVGMLNHREKLACLRDAAVFVLPSYSENFGIVIVEALACRTPVAISDRVNIWREIEAADCGLVAPPEIDATARNIAALVDDAPRARAMGEKGRAMVAAKFDWAMIAQQLESVYRSLAKSRKAA